VRKSSFSGLKKEPGVSGGEGGQHCKKKKEEHLDRREVQRGQRSIVTRVGPASRGSSNARKSKAAVGKEGRGFTKKKASVTRPLASVVDAPKGEAGKGGVRTEVRE